MRTSADDDGDLYAPEPFYGEQAAVSTPPHSSPHAAAAPIVPLREAVDAAQRAVILQALASTGQNWSRAARVLQLDSSNLHKLARKLGLK
jgi:anaerobic nitric oxide reductase transcription regulator